MAMNIHLHLLSLKVIIPGLIFLWLLLMLYGSGDVGR